VNPDQLTTQALLNCLIREVSAPEEQVLEDDGHLLVRLARSGAVLRVATRRPSAGLGPRLAGEAALRAGSGWDAVGWEQLAELIAGELTLATGVPNEEFAAQVRSSHAATTAILGARPGGPGTTGTDSDARIARYVRSEQALVAGHRFHPAPKARGGGAGDWLDFAPEAGARFPLRFLAVRDDVLDAVGDATALDRLGGPAAPAGYHALPAHPWQLRLLETRPWLGRALGDGRLVDLGPGSRLVAPTSSVRTVYDPVADAFCKFSLNVRITNCVRKNSWYELAGSVALTRLLDPVLADLAARFPGTRLLREPGYRTVSLGQTDAAEGLAVLVREGLRDHLAPGVTPVLAAALAEPPTVAAAGPQAPGGLLDGRDGDWLLGWWEAYVRAVAPPALHALFSHGVILEPHLQNVLIGVDDRGHPVQAIFRDLEGVKLVAARHGALLASLKPGVASALAYDGERGWNRVAYCLIVNHLAEIAAAVADRFPGAGGEFERALWDRLRAVLAGFARDHGGAPELRAVLAGVPLPAKANLRLRWARGADREAAYLAVRNPLGGRPALRAREVLAAC
jgi:siderophore synthetase component